MNKIWKTILNLRVLHPVRDVAIGLYGFHLKRQRFTPEMYAHIEWLKETERFSLVEIRQLQSDLLVQIVNHAYANVPFYRKQFDDQGIEIGQIQGLDDLTLIPIINKDDIRQNFHEMLAKNINPKDYRLHRTSGTTGEKLIFAISKQHHWLQKTAHMYRFFAWAGIQPLDRRITLGARVISEKPPHWIFNRWENQLLMSIHHLNRQTVDSYLDKCRAFQPVFMQGHPTGITYLAERLLETGQRAPIKAIMTTGETLTDQQRAVIEEAFGCQVFDSYGQGEGLFYAAQCEAHGEYHESSEFGIIELRPQTDQPDGLASVIGTSLHNYAMPMLRYETGDLAAPSTEIQCRCGRGLPLKIKRVIGRIDDRIYLSNNTTDYILPVTVRMNIKPLLKPGQNYQFRQLDLDRYRFSLVTPTAISSHELHAFKTTLHKLVGESAQIDFETCERITTSGGKVRNVVSDVSVT